MAANLGRVALPQSDGLTDQVSPSIHRAVADVNRAYGAQLALRSRFSGGLQGGAYLLEDPDGRVAVLKWFPDPRRLPELQRVAQAVEAVRSVGYPTPAWLVVGATDEGVYQLTKYTPGEPATPLTLHNATQLVGVLEQQAGLNPLPERDWSEYVTATVLDSPAYGSRQTLERLGQPGLMLIDHYHWLLGLLGPTSLPTTDLVHGDFNSCNVLIHNRRISGVIDIEALGSGSRVIDYAWLLREAWMEGAGQPDQWATLAMIRTAAEAVAGPSALALCVAATAFDIAVWTSNTEPADLSRVLDRLHQLADYLARPA